MGNPTLGGQAVIEGVMIKGKHVMATAVRKENGKIVVKKEKLRRFRFKFMSFPFVRGFANLIMMMAYGMRSLLWSANQIEDEDEEEVFSAGMVFSLLVVSLLFSIGLFVALPYVLTDFFGVKEALNPILFNTVDGIVKIVIFTLYLVFISLFKDVRRLFQYHGAEHKVVHCYESNEPLTVENCHRFSTLHKRCGTSFIIIVFLVSIFVFSIIPMFAFELFPWLATINIWLQKLVLFPVRLAFIPLVAGIAYELLHLVGKYKLLTFLATPGLAMQMLTTNQPDDKQLTVAIKAMDLVIEEGDSV